MFAQIIPKGRTLKDKYMYKFMNWWLRKNQKEIKAEIEKNIGGLLLIRKRRKGKLNG